ncbi:MAG TPA: GNAT family N-acetyltransferase, partial [Caldilineae bacterium]|nr:GNAT family N-acetyltransferase [Caldilineae bacterium]
MPISLHPASEFTTDQLTALLNASYDDYATPIRFRPHQFDFFIHAHDILLSQSLVAQAGDVPIGVVLLARREERGWVAGLGVAPEHRGRGVARALMSNVMEHARTLGLQRLQLEVLSDNAHARKLYEDLGWQLGRELLVWERDEEQGPLPIHRERAVKIEPSPLLEGYFDAWHETRPCWQREKATLLRYAEAGMQGWAIVRNETPVAYVLGFPPRQGRMHLLDVAVDPEVGYKSAGRAMIQNLHGMFKTTTQLPNEPVDSQLNFLFAAMAYHVVLRQNEMTFEL